MTTRTDVLVDTVIDRTITLAQIPAPNGRERARAEVVAGWWSADGHTEVHVDDAGNVWACVHPGAGAATMLAAHLDTVFGTDVVHTVVRDGDVLRGPSVGDDAVGVAALSAAAALVPGDGSPLWLIATVGEEGVGNLRGVSAALDAPPAAVGALLAVEGNYLGRVSAVGVGSVRSRVEVRAPGGHAWEAAATPSAVHVAAEQIARIAAISRPAGTAVNVGRTGGGEGLTMRAQAAWYEIDLRADDPDALAALDAAVDAIVRDVGPPVEATRDPLGARPAGRVTAGHPLVRVAEAALTDAGIEVARPATSTDANAAHARGVPAIALGVTTGSGEHTTQEWIDLPPLATGIRVLADTVDRYGKERA